MSDVIEGIFTMAAVIAAFAFVAFCIAWLTILPTIGLLYWMGYLK